MESTSVEPPGSSYPRKKIAAAVIVLFAFYFGLAVIYSEKSSTITSVWDVWFGSDVARQVMWAEKSSYWDRAHWHPASAALFKIYGLVLKTIEIEKIPPALFSIPVIFSTALAISFTLAFIGSASNFGIAVSTAVLVGPTILWAPVAESAMLGGAALLLQAALMFQVMKLQDNYDSPHSSIGKRFALSIIFGCLATGFTLTNIVPASVIAFSRPSLWRLYFSHAILTSGLSLVGGILLIHFLSMIYGIPEPWQYEAIHAEQYWTSRPSLTTLFDSTENIVVSQFGIPSTRIKRWRRQSGARVVSLLKQPKASTISLIASALWLINLAALFKSVERTERKFLLASCIALASIVAEHTMIAFAESDIFAPHAWPYLILPLFFTLTLRQTKSLIGKMAVAGALILSAIQTVIGLTTLFRLLPKI